jgi:lactobin A/cerein 7B family class IIb bacteriocin
MTSEMLFEKRTVAELAEAELMDVNGGATPAILVGAGAFLLGVEIAAAGYAFGQWLAGK